MFQFISGLLLCSERALGNRQLERVDRGGHVLEALAPWNEPQPVALFAVLERLQPEPIELAHQLVDAPAVVGQAADTVAPRQLGDE